MAARRTAGTVWLAGPVALSLLAAPPLHAGNQDPLSAIPWLSETLAKPQAAVPPPPVPAGPKSAAPTKPVPAPTARPSQPATVAPAALSAPEPPAAGAATEDITVQSIEGPDRSAAGLVSPKVAGLPADLWLGSDATRLAGLLRAMPPLTHPALQDLFDTLLVVEAEPPAGSGDTLLVARVDALLLHGALDPAQALLERAGPDTPDLFRRWFDISLLQGTEDRACATFDAKPDLTPNYPTRTFCLARGGRWYTAALTLETATALGQIDAASRDRMARFLDPDLFEGEPSPAVPDPVTPLDFRVLEAIGEPVPTTDLPLAFAQTDLRHIIGWKAQLEAAERLARVGALPANQLLGIYTARKPAASGGVWDRVALIQALDIALTAGNAEDVAGILPEAFEAMHAVGLEAVVSEIFAPRLIRLPLPDPAAAEAYQMALISNGRAAFAPPRAGLALPRMVDYASALAQETTPTVTAPNELASTLHRGLTTDGVPDRFAEQVRSRRLGEALIEAITVLAQGPGADPTDAGDAVQLIRAVGLEDAAKQAALQVLLLDPRG